METGSRGEEPLYPRIESVEVHRGIEALVRAKYADSILALEDGGLWIPGMEGQGGMVRPPSMEETIAILSSLTNEQIGFALEGGMRRPELLLKAMTGFGRYRKMLDTGTKLCCKGYGQGNTFVLDSRRAKFAAEDQKMDLTDERIGGWEIGIGEGEELDPQQGILKKLLTKWASELPNGVVIASPREHAILVKLGIVKTQNPIDRRTWSPLRSDEDGRVIGEDGFVSGGGGNGDTPCFCVKDPGIHCASAVCRPVVMKES